VQSLGESKRKSSAKEREKKGLIRGGGRMLDERKGDDLTATAIKDGWLGRALLTAQVRIKSWKKSNEEKEERPRRLEGSTKGRRRRM